MRIREIIAESISDFEFDLDKDRGRLEVYDSQGGPAGRVEFYDPNEDRLQEIEISMIIVRPQYQRQGLATAMYRYLEQQGYRILDPQEVTPDGQKFFGKVKDNVEEAEASDDELRQRWGDFDPEDRVMLPRTKTNLQPAATLWSAYEVIENILGREKITTDDDKLEPGMYFVYETSGPPQFIDDEEGGGSISVPNFNSTAAGDVAVAAHEAFHALVHNKARGGMAFTNEKIINNMTERWLRKNLKGTQLHAALEKIVGSRVSYGKHHLSTPRINK